MSRGLNKVLLIGNLGGDPVVKTTATGTTMGMVSLATCRGWQDKQTGEAKTLTEWHKIAFFGKLAEIAGQYLHKGSKIYIEGNLRTRKWTDNTGIERYTTEIIADEMVMLDRAPASTGSTYGFNKIKQGPVVGAASPLPLASESSLYDGFASRAITTSTPLSSSPTNIIPDDTAEIPPYDDIPF